MPAPKAVNTAPKTNAQPELSSRRAKSKPYERKNTRSTVQGAPPKSSSLKHKQASAESKGPSSEQMNSAPASHRCVRPLYEAIARKQYPGVSWRHDFDLVLLGAGVYKPKNHGDFYEFADKELSYDARRYHGDVETGKARALDFARSDMDSPAQISGVKPELGDNEDVHTRPIPGSEFSIRLFGKYMEDSREYGLDFMHTTTGEPQNSPFQHELYVVQPRGSQASRSSSLSDYRIYSVEHGLGEKNINPGEEKFILQEGLACLLKRPGHRNVYLEVPVQSRPDAPTVDYDADILDFQSTLYI